MKREQKGGEEGRGEREEGGRGRKEDFHYHSHIVHTYMYRY